MALWQMYYCDPLHPGFFRIGRKAIRVGADNLVWQIHCEAIQPDDEHPLPGTPTLSASDKGFLVRTKTEPQSYWLLPALPSKPVVLKLNLPLNLAPDSEVKAFVKLPVFVQVFDTAYSPENLLAEFASEDLPLTWFGAPDSGEACFELATALGFDLPRDVRIHEAVCPLWMGNNSNEQMRLTKICLHVEHLDLYYDGKNLFTSVLRIIYKGEAQAGDLSIRPASTVFPDLNDVMTKAREPWDNNIFKRSFSFIKSVYQP